MVLSMVSTDLHESSQNIFLNLDVLIRKESVVREKAMDGFRNRLYGMSELVTKSDFGKMSGWRIISLKLCFLGCFLFRWTKEKRWMKWVLGRMQDGTGG